MKTMEAIPERQAFLRIHVVAEGERLQKHKMRCAIGKNIFFNMSHLESYLFAAEDPAVYDAMLVAAAVEFADRRLRRPSLSWRRHFNLDIPVSDPDRWGSNPVTASLVESLTLLTGDQWIFHFRKARQEPTRSQDHFIIPDDSIAVIPFSDGLDSRAAAGLLALELGPKLVRVRLGKKNYMEKDNVHRPFMAVPYRVRGDKKGDLVESSARSRGFKFAILSGLAAYLAKASQVFVPESGQGALGPVLIPVGQGYEDYRTHPIFARTVEKFLDALLGHRIKFEFPRLWFTKGETLREYVNRCREGSTWVNTWSCWQQSRQCSVEKKKRHCGICAACMLRRLSVHAANLKEPAELYVWENLAVPRFEHGAARTFKSEKITRKMREYAIAGILHMDHLANLHTSKANDGSLRLNIFRLSRSLEMPELHVKQRLSRLLNQHEHEWSTFLESLGTSSFVTKWARGGS